MHVLQLNGKLYLMIENLRSRFQTEKEEDPSFLVVSCGLEKKKKKGVIRERTE